MKKLSLSAIVASVILSSAVQLSASDEVGINVQVTGTSNYHVRGISQTDGKAALQGDLIFSYGNFYAGIWASNLDLEYLGDADADLEIDYYAGYANSYKDLAFSATYAKYTYPGAKAFETIDEVKFDLSYTLDQLTLGAKYEAEVYKQDKSEKVDYVEGYASYDFGLAALNVSTGSFENYGDNFKVGLSKAGTFADQDVEFRLNYLDFDAETTSGLQNDEFIYGEVVFTF